MQEVQRKATKSSFYAHFWSNGASRNDAIFYGGLWPFLSCQRSLLKFLFIYGKCGIKEEVGILLFLVRLDGDVMKSLCRSTGFMGIWSRVLPYAT